jgi:hypothetical protein
LYVAKKGEPLATTVKQPDRWHRKFILFECAGARVGLNSVPGLASER